jgi:hypothetical protein
MNLRGDDTVSAVAVVVESDTQFGAAVSENGDWPSVDGASPSAEGEPNGDTPNGDG